MGISRGSLASLEAATEPAGAPCPQVTEEEAQTVAKTSHRLATAVDLTTSLARLNAWLARAVTTHELRHVKDDGADGEALPCAGCPPHLGGAARAELSAYLAGLGSEGVAYLSLYQACSGAQDGAPAGAAPAGAAVAALTPAVLPEGCQHGPPADLEARARTLEERLFRRPESVSLPADFPVTLAITR